MIDRSRQVLNRSVSAIVASLSIACCLPPTAYSNDLSVQPQDVRLIAGFPFFKSDSNTDKSTGEPPQGDQSVDKEKQLEKEKKKKAKKQTQSPTQSADREQTKAAVSDTDTSALMSLLNDLSRSLSDSEQASKLQDPGQKTVIKLAQNILSKRLAYPTAKPNGIVEKGLGHDSLMTAQAWTSGDIPLADGGHASIAAVWARRENGLINVTITGHLPNDNDPAGKVKEFIVVLSGHSSFEKSFDKQSQANTTAWLAKLASINIESDYRKAGEPTQSKEKSSGESATSETSVKAAQTISPVVTEPVKRAAAAPPAAPKNADIPAVSTAGDAMKIIEPPKVATSTSSVESETLPAKASAAESTSHSANQTASKPISSSVTKERAVAAVDEHEPAPSFIIPQSEYMLVQGVSPAAAPEKKVPPTPQPARIQIESVTPESKVDSAANSSVKEQSIGWAGPSTPKAIMPTGATMQVVLPARAVAGQYLTASVLDSNKLGQSGSELSFNGAAQKTDSHGHANFMVPADATPGHSLNVILSTNPQQSGQVEILQPLVISAQQQTPSIDHTTAFISANAMLTIDGHNFDGVAEHNTVTIDGTATEVRSASPVQLRVLPPNGIKVGNHTFVVDTDGLTSNQSSFDFIVAEVTPDPKEASREQLTKLLVKVLGTTEKVAVHLINESPDIIQVSQGNDCRVTTTGGDNNQAVVSVQRLRKGTYKIAADIQ